VTYGCELFGPFLLSDDIIRTPIKYQDGTISAPAQGPGLGVELDQEKVSKYAIHAPIVITEKSR
jgi:muconate cycloisomerase